MYIGNKILCVFATDFNTFQIQILNSAKYMLNLEVFKCNFKWPMLNVPNTGYNICLQLSPMRYRFIYLIIMIFLIKFKDVQFRHFKYYSIIDKIPTMYFKFFV